MISDNLSTWEKLVIEKRRLDKCAKARKGTPASQDQKANVDIYENGKWTPLTAEQLSMFQKGVKK